MRKYFGQLAAFCFFLAAASCFLTAIAGSPEERATRMIVGGALAGLAGAILFFDALTRRVKKVESKAVPFSKPIKEETQTWTQV